MPWMSVLVLGLSSCTTPSPTPAGSETASLSPNPQAQNSPQSSPQTQSPVRIASSSSTLLALTLLQQAYQTKKTTAQVELVTTSQSSGAIATVRNNKADIAFSSHPIKSEEHNGQLQYLEIAQDLLIVATHDSVKGVKNLSTAQLKAIYTGKITHWKDLGGPDAAIVLLDRPEDESAKKLLRKYYLGQDKTSDRAIVLNKETELIDTLKATPYAIGAFSYAASQLTPSPIQPLHLNSIEPSLQTFVAGKYPMVRHIGIVWRKAAPSEVQQFINFVRSPEGQQVLQTHGFMPTAK